MPKRLGAKAKTPTNPVTRRRNTKNRDPNRHYHFARSDRVSIHHDDKGYVIEKDPEGGPIQSGQDILMSCSRQEYEQRVRERNREAAEDRRGPVEAFKTQGLRSGVPMIDISRERAGSMRSVLGEPDPRLRE